MAATMGLFEHYTGTYTASSSGTNVAGGNVYFYGTNNASADGMSAHPVTKPGTSFTNSYERYLHPRASGTYTTVGNTYVYVQSTTLATGVDIYFKTTNPYTGGSPGASGFTTPVVPGDNTGGTQAATGTTSVIASGSAKSLHVGNTGTVGPNATADVGDWLVAWASVASTAAAGPMGTGGSNAATVIVIQWDET
jgi:hypothetical protein